MAIEIERKFLVENDNWKPHIRKTYRIKQGYLNLEIERSVRIRIKGDKGYITIKGVTNNISRAEFEYEIPFADAEKLINLCVSPIIEKTRHEIVLEENTWEIDEFYGENKGLIIAELELKSEQQEYKTPNWLGVEVSNDPQYYNLNLVTNPFNTWNLKKLGPH